MNRSYSNRRNALPGIVGSALFAGIVANAACAKDVGNPGAVQRISSPAANVLQDENLVPEYPDESNPGALEPLGSLWAQLDEDTPNDDVDYMYRYRTGLPPTYSQATVNLSDPVGTPSSSQTHTLKVRWKVTGNYSTTTPQPTLLQYSLREGSNVIHTSTLYPSGDSYVSASTELTEFEKSQITNYPALTIRFSMQLKPASGSDQIQGRVTWARLEIR